MQTEIDRTEKKYYWKNREGVEMSLVRIPKPLIKDLHLVFSGDQPHMKETDTKAVHSALQQFLEMRRKNEQAEQKAVTQATVKLAPGQMLICTDDVLVVPVELQVAIVEHLSDLNCLTWQEAVLRMLNSEITTAKEFSFD